jgi:hypothetical protein
MARKDNGLTLELPGITKRRGRPSTGKAKTGAQRQAAYRAKRMSVEASDRVKATIKRLAADFDLPVSDVTRALLQFALCNRNWQEEGFPSLLTKNDGGAK